MLDYPLGAASPGIITGLVLFLLLTTAIGVFSGKLIKKSSRNYIVAGQSLPLVLVGTMLAAAAVDGNGTLGSVGLGYIGGISHPERVEHRLIWCVRLGVWRQDTN